MKLPTCKLTKTDKLLADLVGHVYAVFWPRREPGLHNSAIVATKEWRLAYLDYGLPYPFRRLSDGPARRRQMLDRRALVNAGHAVSVRPGHLQLTPAGEFRARALMGMAAWSKSLDVLRRLESLHGSPLASGGFLREDVLFLRAYCDQCNERHWIVAMEGVLPLLVAGLVESTDRQLHVAYRRTKRHVPQLDIPDTGEAPSEAYTNAFNEVYVAAWSRMLKDLETAEPDHRQEVHVRTSASATDGTLEEIQAAWQEVEAQMDRSPHNA